MSSFPILPNQQSAVNPAVPSYLDNTYSNSASRVSRRKRSGPLTGRQKWVFARLKSFMTACTRLTPYLKLVHFTTAPGGRKDLIRRHHQELVRRAERVFRCRVVTFVVSTREGHGVLHTVWACVSTRGVRVFIPYEWIRQQWLEIHGAYEVRIRALGGTEGDRKRAASYYATQYFAGQDKLERVSYSYRKLGIALAKTWTWFKQETYQYSLASTWCGLNSSCVTIDRQALFRLWDELLITGQCIVADRLFYLDGFRFGSF